MTLVPESAAEAVANGAQMLDEHEPGWWRSISLEKLKLSSACDCVCGQLACGWYEAGIVRYREATGWGDTIIPNGYNAPRHSFAVAYGFDHPDAYAGPRRWTYGDLDREWKQAIVARLVADKIVAPVEVPEQEAVCAHM